MTSDSPKASPAHDGEERCSTCGCELEDPRLLAHECPPGFQESSHRPDVTAMAAQTPQDPSSLVQKLIEDIHRDSLALVYLGRAVAHLVEAIGFEPTCARLQRSASWVSKHSRLDGLPTPVLRAIQEGRIKDADAAHDMAAVWLRSPRAARELLERPVVTRAAARELRRQLERSANATTTFDTLSRDQRDDVARRFLAIMENVTMSPVHKLTALVELSRDAQSWTEPET